MNLKENMSNIFNKTKENTSILGYVCSKYILEILVSLIVIAAYIAMFLSYALMNISDKVTIFVNITYSDFSDYKLEKILDTGIKQFYTKFPSMKKYFVSIKIKKEQHDKLKKSEGEVIDLTQSDDDNMVENLTTSSE